jgi:hypothetical protein
MTEGAMKTYVPYKASTEEAEAMRRVVRYLVAYYKALAKKKATGEG